MNFCPSQDWGRYVADQEEGWAYKENQMQKTIVWNVKGQINSEYQVVNSDDKDLIEQLNSSSEIYGVKVLDGAIYPSQGRDGSRWLDNRRVG